MARWNEEDPLKKKKKPDVEMWAHRSAQRLFDEETKEAHVETSSRRQKAWFLWFFLGIATAGVVFYEVTVLFVHRRERFRAAVKAPPELESRIRWGVAGLGRIGHDFSATLTLRGGTLVAVAAGSLPERQKRAKSFADFFSTDDNKIKSYDSYEKLALDPDVDIVYVANTNNLHMNTTLLFLEHGKHVLVEKPTSTNAEDALAMLTFAKKQNRLLVTNYWNAAFPAVKWAKEKAQRDIGDIHAFRGDMGFQAVSDPFDRFLNKKLGGGATLDMGCYLVQSMLMFMGEDEYLKQAYQSQLDSNMLLPRMPQRVTAFGDLAPTGVDIEVAAVVQVLDKRGVFAASMQRGGSPFNFEVLAEHGSVTLAAPANCPASASLTILEDANYPEPHVVKPCCGQPSIEQTNIKFELPPLPAHLEPQYPGTLGFSFMIFDIQNFLIAFQDNGCDSEENYNDDKSDDNLCNLDFPLVPHWMQIATQQIADDIIQQVQLQQSLIPTKKQQ